jgi:acyl-coenzyme A synthetase/AMP-(fatty) acid ligase
MWRTYPFAAGEVACQKTALSFVDSVWEIFGPLLCGVSSVVLPDAVIEDSGLLVETLGRTGVTRLVLVPSLLRVLLDTHPNLAAKLPRLGRWFTSGEALDRDLCLRFRKAMPHAVLTNLYGCSEASADSTYFDAPENVPVPVPIGRPIDATEIYVLDGDMRPVPVGMPGELYIGGVGLARGYLGMPAMTAIRFVPNPFGREDSARLYRTGDRARWLPEGILQYLGRTDHQVKLRGMRVELTEIEAALAARPEVGAAVVVAREEVTGDKRLVAYLVAAKGSQVDVPSLRATLRASLPDHMIPSAFVVLERLPLTPNGKIDRNALGDIGAPIGTTEFVAPRSPLEELLAEIWRDVLVVERVGIHDNFFDLGGHSLLAMQVVSRATTALRRKVGVRILFEYPSIAELAGALDLETLDQGES